jgi:hypothetical protein
LDKQAENEALRLDSARGTGGVGIKKNAWVCRVNPHTGIVKSVEHVCGKLGCSYSQEYPAVEILQAVGPGILLRCPQCKSPWNFSRDAYFCLVPGEGVATDEAVAKQYEQFFKLAEDTGVKLSMKDYLKGPDGNYWLNICRTYEVLSLLDKVPTALHKNEDSTRVISTEGPDPKVEYEIHDPEGAAPGVSAGFGSPASQGRGLYGTLHDDEAHVRRQLRHELRYGSGKPEDEAFEEEVERRMKPYIEQRARTEKEEQRDKTPKE